jgi:hypothetical protein
VGRTGRLGCLHDLTKLLYGRHVDRTGPIWPPDELLGPSSGDGLVMTAPSAGDQHTPLREPIEPVWLVANDAPVSEPAAAPVSELAAAPVEKAAAEEDIRLTADDWLGDDALDATSAPVVEKTTDWRSAGTVWGEAFNEAKVVEGSIVEETETETETAPSEPVPVHNSPWSDPPRSSRERGAIPGPRPAAESSGPAPGVYDVPSEWITPPEAVDPRGSMLMRQVTVVCRNANAGRAVARLLTITLQHDDPEAWARAAGKIRSESDFAHAGDLLARDQALTVIDAGPDVRAMAWERAVDAADHLIVAVNAAGSGPAEAAALAKSKHADLATHAVTVVLMPVSRWGLTRGHEDVAAIRDHFTQRSHAVFLAPFDLRPTSASRNVWREIAETVRAELPEI